MHKNYELVVLLHPDLEIDVETPITKVEGLVQAAGGRITKKDNWGKKRLAYKIAKQDFAIYVYFEIAIDPTKVRDLENTILITEEVLRHILVTHEEATTRSVKKESKPDDSKSVEAISEDKVDAEATK